MTTIWVFVLVWGVWLITPLVFDGLEAFFRLLVVWFTRPADRRHRSLEDAELPTISLIVPAHNEEAVIDRCLASVKAQDYPHHKLEVIVIDDGSTDRTAELVEVHVNGNGEVAGRENGSFILGGRAIHVGPFRGEITLIKNGHMGKAHALNAGIQASSGDIIVNIDSDVTLAPDAIRNIATSFHLQPDLGAATGNIEIDWDMIEDRDEAGRLILDADGNIQTKRLSALQKFLAKSQFLEYLSSFRLGRESQAAMGAIYTLAGACSAFRRDVLEQGTLYSNRTVSEDTDLTLDLHRGDVRIGFLRGARVFLEPVIDWDSLYAQRVRWTRGQLEVCSLNEDLIAKRGGGALGRFALPQMLLFDHTLAFPRLVWAPLILFFPLLGYSWGTIVQAVVAMYALYVIIEAANALYCYTISPEDTRHRIERCGWTIIGLPLYRFVVFHFRFSGFLVTLKEEQQWTMPGPVSQGRRDFDMLRIRSIEFATIFASVLAAGLARAIRVAQMVLPGILAIALATSEWLQTFRKDG